MTKTIVYPSGDPLKLVDELQVVPGLAPVPGDDGKMDAQFTISQAASGEITLVVPDPTDEAAVDAVYAAHDPVPLPVVVDFAGRQDVDAITRTTDATATEVFRFPCELKHIYRASLVIIGVDAGSGATKVMDGRFVWKRWSAGAIMTGITVVSDLHDSAAASWAPNALPQGNDIVFTVQGAAGRTIDWLLVGDVSQYAPEGLGG